MSQLSTAVAPLDTIATSSQLRLIQHTFQYLAHSSKQQARMARPGLMKHFQFQTHSLKQLARMACSGLMKHHCTAHTASYHHSTTEPTHHSAQQIISTESLDASILLHSGQLLHHSSINIQFACILLIDPQMVSQTGEISTISQSQTGQAQWLQLYHCSATFIAPYLVTEEGVL